MEKGTSASAACCVLCAATLGVGLSPSAGAADNAGGVGSSSSASVQIRVTVAQRGAVRRLGDLVPAIARSNGEPLCLWLNTGTRGYSLAARTEGQATHLLTWATRDKSVELGEDPSATLTAAARPSCTKEEQAQLSARRISPRTGGGAVTILVGPE